MTQQHPLSHGARALVLGSTSRYRRELLERLRQPFEVLAPEVDETPRPGEAPAALAQRLALAKARAVAAQRPDAIVIGSDQVADLDGEPLGKPGNHERAVAQLRRMSGQTVLFQTALAPFLSEAKYDDYEPEGEPCTLAPAEVLMISPFFSSTMPQVCRSMASGLTARSPSTNTPHDALSATVS